MLITQCQIQDVLFVKPTGLIYSQNMVLTHSLDWRTFHPTTALPIFHSSRVNIFWGVQSRFSTPYLKWKSLFSISFTQTYSLSHQLTIRPLTQAYESSSFHLPLFSTRCARAIKQLQLQVKLPQIILWGAKLTAFIWTQKNLPNYLCGGVMSTTAHIQLACLRQTLTTHMLRAGSLILADSREMAEIGRWIAAHCDKAVDVVCTQAVDQPGHKLNALFRFSC